MADDLLLLVSGTGTDHLLLTTGDDLLLTTSGGLVTGTMSATFGSLTATMIGHKVISGVLAATFGGLTGTLSGGPFSPSIIAELQRSLWDAELVPGTFTSETQVSSWRADLQQ